MEMTKINRIGIIPARLNSKRLPKKILADIQGKPMVIRTAEQVSKCKKIDRVIIAIDSHETLQALKGFDYEIIMTSLNHKSGTDRIAEVINNIDDADIIINIQADEPFIDPELIDKLVEVHSDSSIEMSTLISTRIKEKDYEDESIVKAFLDENNFAVDFLRKGSSSYKHLGIYGFTKKTLLRFVNFDRSNSEKNRSLEQMRALENGIKIKAIITDKDSLSINTLGDLTRIKIRDH
jgi:3-deoxy-manno-octulosonate cytidylyltransferase (CMP-KDO synthetase)